jgi:hypothetical protein
VSTASAVPGALRAIYSLLTANLGPNVGVIVGPGATDDPEANGLVLIAVDDADETSYAHAVTGSQAWAQLGGKIRDETFSVHCVAVAWTGNADAPGDVAALDIVDSVYALMKGITDAIVADPTLSGSVLTMKGITSHSLRFVTDNSGLAAHIPFDIECMARI